MRIPLQTQLGTFEALNERRSNLSHLMSASFEYSLCFCGFTGPANVSGAVKKAFGVESLP
jgi:aerobic-type carbon monoxide dehydrogenase small subunit (CoxS/CutS family)